MNENSQPGVRPLRYLLPVLTALVLAAVLYVRVRLLNVPLERDEGEFAYMGQLLLKGFPPFMHAYTMKLPGVSMVYAFFMLLFGQSAVGIHLGLLVANLLSTFFVYLLARRVLDRDSALLSCATYALLSVSQSVLGVFAHATHFVVLFSLAGLLLLLRSLDARRSRLLFAAGLCFGVAITMKQHAAFLTLFGLGYYAWRAGRGPNREWKALLSASAFFVSGTVVPYVLLLVWVAAAGKFDEFWFWTVQYAGKYASGNTLLEAKQALALQFSSLRETQPLLWLFAGVGAIFLCGKFGRGADRSFIFGYLAFSLLSICPGFVFRNHYFVLLLPALSLLAGAVPYATGRLLLLRHAGSYWSILPVLVWMAAASAGMYQERDYLFTLSPPEASRKIYGANPFPEAPQVADYLKRHTAPGDQIAVLGSEPQILFYADRISATGYIYMYGLMEDQPYAERMQMRMIEEIEQARPKYIVYANVAVSWLVRGTSKQNVIVWGDGYLHNLYDLTGVVRLFEYSPAVYYWDADAAGQIPKDGWYLCIFKRKGGV